MQTVEIIKLANNANLVRRVTRTAYLVEATTFAAAGIAAQGRTVVRVGADLWIVAATEKAAKEAKLVHSGTSQASPADIVKRIQDFHSK